MRDTADEIDAATADVPARTRWTFGKIIKRIVVGVTALSVSVAMAAVILSATTDTIADRRESRLAAAGTWQVDGRDIPTATQSGNLAAADLVIVPIRQANAAGLIEGQKRLRRLRFGGRADQKRLVMAWLPASALGLPKAADAGAKQAVADAAAQAQAVIGPIIQSGADGVVIDFARADRPTSKTALAEAVAQVRRMEPTFIVTAHMPAARKQAQSVLSSDDARAFDALLHVATPATRTTAQTAASKPGTQTIYRDWALGRPLLILGVVPARDGSDTGSDFVTSLDFLPRTRLP